MKSFQYFLVIISFTVLSIYPLSIFGQRTRTIEIQHIGPGDVECRGFTLTQDGEITITGAGVVFDNWDHKEGFYGWILNSDTREVVWNLLESDKHRRMLYRERVFDFKERIRLKEGNYEAYYAGLYSHDGVDDFGDLIKEFFDLGSEELRHREKRRLKMAITAPESILRENNAHKTVDRLSEQAIISFIRARDDERFEQGFSLTDETKLHIYAQAEISDGNLYDYAWIYDVKSNRKVWDMNENNAEHAGGGDKNVLVDEEITLPAGSYTVHYMTDGSHSYRRWNVFPPYDPQFWGVTIWPATNRDRNNVVDFRETDIPEPVVEMVRIRDEEHTSQGITLNKSMDLRILCLGEGSDEMVDYGWIVNADTREVIWEMRRSHTDHAGGAHKNRMVNKTIHFPKGNYIVYYSTDGSHSYRDWNAPRPFNPERWGITIWAEDNKDISDIESFDPYRYRSKKVLAEIVRVRDDEYLRKRFTLKKDREIRIVAIGEGRDNEMFDYGWIRNDETGRIEWEMTYRRTRHAGGAHKNRMFNDTIYLRRGDYTVYFETDDSHSYRDWNATPPRQQNKYGITVLLEE